MNFGSFDLNLLRVLDALLETRSATHAGQRIGLSQPAVSAAGLPHLQDAHQRLRAARDLGKEPAEARRFERLGCHRRRRFAEQPASLPVHLHDQAILADQHERVADQRGDAVLRQAIWISSRLKYSLAPSISSEGVR